MVGYTKLLISENAFNNDLSYFNNLNGNSVFQFVCKQLPSGTNATTNLCFWLEIEKTTVFFYTNTICKAFSFYANFSLTVAMYMADREMAEALKSAGLKST